MKNYTYSVKEAKQEIKDSIRIYMQKDENGSYILPEYRKNPFYLTGAPGIGKTEMVRQIAQELNLGFFATSVTHHTRNSMLGLPVITEQKWGKYTEYTMPDILAQIEKRQRDGEKEGILLIDEFASMSEALVAPMLAFLQSKTVGNHRLPEGWVMILCSNPPEFNETAREFDAAVMDRVRLMQLEYSKEDFLEYAETHNIHPCIRNYLCKNDQGGYLCRKKNGKSEIVTARGWENLSDCLYGYEKMESEITERLIYQFIKSEKTATDFYRFYLTNKMVFTAQEVESILNGEGLENCFTKVRKYSYMKKWQTLNYILDVLSQECQNSMEDSDLIEDMKEQREILETDMEEGDPVFPDMEEDDESYRLELALREWMNGEESINTKARNVPEKEKKLLQQIWKRLQKEKKQNGWDVCPGENVFHMIDSVIGEFASQKEENDRKVNMEIINALKFARRINETEEKKQLSMLEAFLRNINKDRAIMKFLALTENEEYIKLAMEMSA